MAKYVDTQVVFNVLRLIVLPSAEGSHDCLCHVLGKHHSF